MRKSKPGKSVNNADRTYDVAIVGGGIHGCSVALHLAMKGVRVVVIEKDYSGRHASGVNAGGVRRLARDTREIALSDASLKIWQGIDDLLGAECGFAAKGHLQVAENDEELATLAARVKQLNSMGFSHEVLVDREELRAIVPAVSDHCVGGIFVAEDGAAMPYQTVQAFFARAQSLGVTFLSGCEVLGIRRAAPDWHLKLSTSDTVSAPNLVNCAGAWSGRVCEMLGEFAPVEPIAPMLSITAPMDHFVDPVVSATTRILSFKQYENGTVMIGGGLIGKVDFSRNRAELDYTRLGINARTALDLFPIMGKAKIVRTWAGIEGRMPDDIPVIGPSLQHENLWHSFGYSAHGFQLGPIVGSVISELIVEGRPSIDITEFSIGRFAESNQTRQNSRAL